MASEPTYDKLELLGLHEPDSGDISSGDGDPNVVALPGTYTVGFMRNGNFKRLFTFKAAGMLADEARAQAAADSAATPNTPAG